MRVVTPALLSCSSVCRVHFDSSTFRSHGWRQNVQWYQKRRIWFIVKESNTLRYSFGQWGARISFLSLLVLVHFWFNCLIQHFSSKWICIHMWLFSSWMEQMFNICQWCSHTQTLSAKWWVLAVSIWFLFSGQIQQIYIFTVCKIWGNLVWRCLYYTNTVASVTTHIKLPTTL